MANRSAPARTVPATSDDFRQIAKSAGLKLEGQLQEDSGSARKRIGFDSYEIQPYEKILAEVKKEFRENVRNVGSARGEGFVSYVFYQEFRNLHGGGDFEWRSIRLITSDASLDRSKYSETPGNPWALPLLVGEHNIVGQPLSLYHGFEVRKGDILLGYNIKET
jgi:hypothetical protein